MLSLHKITTEIHIIFKALGIGMVIIIVGYILLTGGNFIKEFFYPTPPAPPTVGFGKIPSLEFPTDVDASRNAYTLDTVTGTLPTFSDRARIYEIATSPPNLLAAERAREKINAFGFKGNGVALTPVLYQWEDTSSPFRIIALDILSYNFSITSSYLQSEDIRNSKNLPTEQKAIETTKNVLSSITAIPLDIDMEKTKTSLLKIENNNLVNATSLSTSQIIRVDLYQKDMDKLPIFYPNPPYSIMNFLVGGGGFDGEIVEAEYFHHTITEKYETYPILSVDSAWEKLKEGKAFIINPSRLNSISIKEVVLGYYLTNKEQKYITPIIVFIGDNDFYAYVPALVESWYENTKPQN